MPSPQNHPNASMAVIVGYVATGCIYAAHVAGVPITPEEATTGATAIIGFVLFLGKKRRSAS